MLFICQFAAGDGSELEVIFVENSVVRRRLDSSVRSSRFGSLCNIVQKEPEFDLCRIASERFKGVLTGLL